MKYSQGRVGRVFVIKMEDKDKLPETLEKFAQEKSIWRGMCILVGGIGNGKIVVGPENNESSPIIPLIFALQGVHEVAGIGTIFPDENGQPRLHMHAALGREGKTRTGCIRAGIEVWKIAEIIVLEILDNTAQRKKDTNVGFTVLET